MPIAQSLAQFQASVQQCDNLIANAHQVDAAGANILPQVDREQITSAAFLNLFIAWEEFLENSINDFMMGDATVGGTQPVKYISPPSREHSAKMIVHVNKYFDFANHEYVKKLSSLFFRDGYPLETPINSIVSDLADLRTIRNACAHFSLTTKTPLEALANRIFGQPQPGISVYRLLTSVDPRGPANVTVYAGYRDKLLTAGGLIAQG